MDYVNEIRLRETLPEDRAAYRAAEPFPHIVLDGFLRDDVATALEAGFPRVDHRLWKHHLHLNAHKFACNRIEVMPPLFQALLTELNAKGLLEYLEELTGIPGLVPDAELEGGGLHQIAPGGYLKVHADFNHHPTTGFHRRLNLLVYLNRDWNEAWNGNLELWSRDMGRCARSVAPVLNRAVLFSTTDFAYHGHPRPLDCPPGTTRKSLALYYYTQDRPAEEQSRPHSTLYKRIPTELIAVNRLRLLGRALLSGAGTDLFRAAYHKLRGR